MMHPIFGAFEVSAGQWLALIAIVPVLLAIEMFLVPRVNPIPLKSALWFSLLWFVLGAGFAIPVAMTWGETYTIKYLSGFFVEKGLDIDQVLVFAVVLARFRAPEGVSRRLIFIALVMGLVMRVPFIALGSLLGETDSTVESLLIAALFVGAGIVLVRQRHNEIDPNKNRFLLRLEREKRVAPFFRGNELTIRRDDRRELTLAGVILVVLLSADLFFAASVPLAFAYSKPGFLVLASSAFATLGFRSLFYAVDGLELDMGRLKIALAVVFWAVAGQLALHTVEEGREPTWLIPLLGLVALLLPVVAAVRGIEEEIDEAAEEETGLEIEEEAGTAADDRD